MTCLDALCGGREDDQVVAAPDVRRGWIQYCREVVGDTGHHTACAKLGGSAATDGFPDDVRWPGYLGPRYAPQGLLWVANVHRNFDSAGFDRAFAQRAVEAVRTFAAGGDEQDFLNVMESTYRTGLARWDVGRWGRNVLARLGVGLDEVAYLNAARCQSTGTGEPLQRLCQIRWPLRSMVDLLRPRIILLTSLTALSVAGPRPWPCTVVAFSQRNGRLVGSSPWKPPTGDLSPSLWIDALAAEDLSRTHSA